MEFTQLIIVKVKARVLANTRILIKASTSTSFLFVRVYPAIDIDINKNISRDLDYLERTLQNAS